MNQDGTMDEFDLAKIITRTILGTFLLFVVSATGCNFMDLHYKYAQSVVVVNGYVSGTQIVCDAVVKITEEIMNPREKK